MTSMCTPSATFSLLKQEVQTTHQAPPTPAPLKISTWHRPNSHPSMLPLLWWHSLPLSATAKCPSLHIVYILTAST
jgi:hypothetical protein